MEPLHSLNALRVIAEFFVVHLHLAFNFKTIGQEDNNPSIIEYLTTDLMCMFFVLSGFVATYSTVEFETFPDCIRYIRKRLHRAYPIFFLNALINTIYAYSDGATHSVNYHLCSIGHFFLISTWCMCSEVEDNMRQAWYLETLFWLWFLFPFLHRYCLNKLRDRTWTKIWILYVVSQIPWFIVILSPISVFSFRRIPINRLAEFLMGCACATVVDSPSIYRNFIVPWCILVVSYFADYFFFNYIQSVTLHPESYPSRPIWMEFHSRTAIMWVYLIHWLAHGETTKTHIPSFLYSDMFKWLSTFSLSLYMTHETIAAVLMQVTLPFPKPFFQMDTLIITTYLLSYAFSITIHPMLNRLFWFLAPEPKQVSLLNG